VRPSSACFSGNVPEDLDTAGGWTGGALSRVVPALQKITTYAEAKGVKIGLQNHGDMTATAEQTIQIVKWVNSPNICIVDDTGYFRPFQAPNGLDYDWYADINAVLPFSCDFQAKLKPAGADQNVTMDYEKLFTGVRNSPYQNVINLERLWFKDDPNHPRGQPTPPFAEIEEFLATVRQALDETKTPPSTN